MQCSHRSPGVAQVFPSSPDSATYSVPLSRVVYIEETDFRETNPDLLPKGLGRPVHRKEKFFGMAPEKECMLKCATQLSSSQSHVQLHSLHGNCADLQH